MAPEQKNLFLFHNVLSVPHVRDGNRFLCPQWRCSAGVTLQTWAELSSPVTASPVTQLCSELVKPLSQRNNEQFSIALKAREYSGWLLWSNALYSKLLDLSFPRWSIASASVFKLEGVSLRRAHTSKVCNYLLRWSGTSAARLFEPSHFSQVVVLEMRWSFSCLTPSDLPSS